MMNRLLLIFCGAALLASCVQAAEPLPPQAELLEFAKANCLLQYFQKKGYDLHDILSISGGIAELGSASPEQYEQAAMLVKNYRPPLKTKQNIDIDLLKCFKMEHDAAFLRSLAEAQ